MPQETVCSKKFNPSMIFVPPLDIAPPSRAISWPNFWRSLPLKERTRDCGPRSLEQLAARGSCSRDSCLLRFGNLGREHGLETADSRLTLIDRNFRRSLARTWRTGLA